MFDHKTICNNIKLTKLLTIFSHDYDESISEFRLITFFLFLYNLLIGSIIINPNIKLKWDYEQKGTFYNYTIGHEIVYPTFITNYDYKTIFIMIYFCLIMLPAIIFPCKDYSHYLLAIIFLNIYLITNYITYNIIMLFNLLAIEINNIIIVKYFLIFLLLLIFHIILLFGAIIYYYKLQFVKIFNMKKLILSDFDNYAGGDYRETTQHSTNDSNNQNCFYPEDIDEETEYEDEDSDEKIVEIN